MKLIFCNNGSYPRIGDAPEHQVLRKSVAQWERKEKADEDLREAERILTRAAIKEQTEAGLDIITDGQIRWYDPISHLAGQLEGVEINGLLRFFDTNFYFRQPVIKGTIRWRSPLTVEEFKFAQREAFKPVKPVLTGPYTLARLSIVKNPDYRPLRRLVEAMTAVLVGEVRALADAGAELIHVDEPSMLKHPEDLPLVSRALGELAASKGRARLALCTYFGDATPLWDQLQNLAVDVLAIDLTYAGKLVDRIAKDGSSKSLAFGLVDGRNTRLEREEEIVAPLERMLPKLRADVAYLHPSCGLEYLPRDRAFLKLQNMVRSAARFRSE